VAIWGKILGGAAGLAIGGPIGAIIGAVAGHAYDSYREQEKRARLAAPGADRWPREDPWPRDEPWSTHRPEAAGWPRDDPGQGWQEPPPVFADPTETRRIAFATAVIVLGAKLAKVDGVVTRDEVRAFKRVFRIDDGEVGDVARIYNQAKASAQGFEPYARQIAALFGHDPFLLEELLNGLFEVARADGELNPAEVDFLRRVAAIFGFDTAAFEMIRARFSATARNLSGADDAYAVLGLTRTASDEEIKQTYRNLVREHHPDRLVAKGMPEEFVERANRTLAAINAAYDRIEKERNLK
jgi:DnaJ like chaperone protein